MGYYFYPHVLLRMPVFPVRAYEQTLSLWLQDDHIMAAVYAASPQFFQQLEKVNFFEERLTDREKLTLRKYINRACFRPTPFGLFASISDAHWAVHSLFLNADIGLQAHISPDQAFSRKAGTQLLQELSNSITYEGNPTLYRVHQFYRFIRTELSEQRRTYQLQSIGFSSVLKDLLSYCKQGKYRSEVISRIVLKAKCSAEEGIEYFEFLTDAQLLLPVQRANINGDDHPKLLSRIYGDHTKDALRRLMTAFGHQPFPTVARLKQLDRRTSEYLDSGSVSGHKPSVNIILNRTFVKGELNVTYQAMIRDGLFALECLGQPQEIRALRQFMLQFQKHFEGQRIPLLLALDPERGIGYQDETQESPNPLLETLNIQPRRRADDNGHWHHVHTYLFQQWLAMERRQEHILRLDEKALAKLNESQSSKPHLGFSILFRASGDELLLENAGGNNAPAMLGRFTVAESALAEQASAMAKAVEALNPDIIFPELLHLSDPHRDNINRRAQIWSYELPITAAAEPTGSIQQLRLDDLYLEIKEQVVYLWSKTYDRYVIPRLTTAYNHVIDTLPLFRFLADLSYQFGLNYFGFDLKEYFPGLNYYPRVSYRNTILSLACWRLTAEQIATLTNVQADSLLRFQDLKATLQLPKYLSVTEGDQQLVFDSEDPADIQFFIDNIRSKTTVNLQEFLYPLNETGLYEEKGSPFVNQFTAYLLPDEPLRLPPVSTSVIKRPVNRKFIPGSEWLYLKIYVPRLGASRILLKIWPLLKKQYPHGKVQQWFFIRYEDHAPHIRLRLKIDPQDINMVLFAFRDTLADHIHQQIIREYQVDIYSRELERYQAGGIELTEAFFSASSHFVMCYLHFQRKQALPPVYLTALLTTRRIIAIFLPGVLEQETFLKSAYEGLLTEFEGKRLKYEMDQKFRETRTAIEAIIKDAQPFGRRSFHQAFKELLQSAERVKLSSDANIPHRLAYLQSLLHMHLNRLFSDEPRKQEMLIYFLLYKQLQSELAKSRRNGN